MRKCLFCGVEFQPDERIGFGDNPANVERMKYCSKKCQKSAANRRYYARHRDELLRIKKKQKAPEWR